MRERISPYGWLGSLLAVSLPICMGQIQVPIKKEYFTHPVTAVDQYVSTYHENRIQQEILASQSDADPEKVHKLLKQQISLYNNHNMAYVGPVYFGTPLQETTSAPSFVYDTGSGFLTTTSTECFSCIIKYYDPDASQTSVQQTTVLSQLEYGTASLQGYLYSDQVCLAEDLCISDFEFFMITSQKGLRFNTGILGLSPPDESQNGPSYLKALYNAGLIDQEQVTFQLGYYGQEDSYVYFGSTPNLNTVGESFKQDLYTRYDSWWTVKLKGIDYGDDSIKDSDIKYAILDTGTSLTYIGKEDYINFLDHVTSAVPELNCSDDIYCYSTEQTCGNFTDRMKPLVIQLQDNYYTMSPEAYTFSASSPSEQIQCYVAVTYTEQIAILGDSFLRNFITTFDFKNSEMRLIQSASAPAGVMIEYKMGGWKITGIVIGCLVGVAMLGWLALCLVKRYKKKKLQQGYKIAAQTQRQEQVSGTAPLHSAGDEIVQEQSDASYKNYWQKRQQQPQESQYLLQENSD